MSEITNELSVREDSKERQINVSNQTGPFM